MAHKSEDAPPRGADDQHENDDDDDEHPLLSAVRRDDVARAVELLQSKRRRPRQGASSSSAAALADAAPLPTDRDGRTVLHLTRSAQMVQALFEHGGPALETLTNSGFGRAGPWLVPLCAAPNAAVVRALLAHGANADGCARDGRKLQHLGQTPLGEAAARLDAESVAALLEAGASASMRNAFGNSPIDRAFLSRHFAVVAAGGGGGGGGGVGGAGTSGEGGAGAAAAMAQGDDDEDGEEEEGESERMSPDEARERFGQTLRLLLRAGGAVKPGYLVEALPLLARADAAAERAAAAALERRRRDPRLSAAAREEVVGLAMDVGELRKAEREVQEKRRRLEELERELGDESSDESDDETDDESESESDDESVSRDA
jgi:hypothetical protein